MVIYTGNIKTPTDVKRVNKAIRKITDYVKVFRKNGEVHFLLNTRKNKVFKSHYDFWTIEENGLEANRDYEDLMEEAGA